MKICLVGQHINGLLGKSAGGTARQIALLARNFARRGHQVTYVVCGYDGPEGMIDGVNVRSGWFPGHGIRGFRYITYRLPRLRRVLKEISADVYYTLTPAFYSRTVMDVAKRIGKTALLGLTSDYDLSIETGKKQFITGNSFIELKIISPLAYQLIYVSALNKANCVISQNLWQEKRCNELKIKSRLILNPVEIPSEDLYTLPEKWDVVWVGNIENKQREIKGFNNLVSLIQKLPDISFGIVGSLYPGLSNNLSEIKQLSNVYFMGPLSHNKTMEMIAQSKLVINTSLVEGFSNVMIEGWALGKPTVSLNVDPNNLLSEGRLGYCSEGDLEEMSSKIQHFLSNHEEYQIISQRCQEYIQKNHSPEVVCKQYEALF